MITVAVIGILPAVALPSYRGHIRTTQVVDASAGGAGALPPRVLSVRVTGTRNTQAFSQNTFSL